MRNVLRLSFLAGSFVALAHGCGCASLTATAAAPRPFAGTTASIHRLPYQDAGGAAWTAIDLPLSLAMDTALLPVTVPCAIAGKGPTSARAFD